VKRNQRNSVFDFSGTYTALSGYCKKKSTKGKWQKRFFEAKDHYLIYKSTEKSQKVLGSIDLLNVGTIRLDNSIGGFTMDLEDRLYKLKVTNKSPIAEEWVRGLKARQNFRETAVGAAKAALAAAEARAAAKAAAIAEAATREDQKSNASITKTKEVEVTTTEEIQVEGNNCEDDQKLLDINRTKSSDEEIEDTNNGTFSSTITNTAEGLNPTAKVEKPTPDSDSCCVVS
jgi:hypothetical protein